MTLVIIIIMFQVLGQMIFKKKLLQKNNMSLNKNGQLENDIFLQSLNDVANNHLL